MKVMLCWRFTDGASYVAGVEEFLSTGAPDPDGLTTIGRWHAPGSKYGFHLVEGAPLLIAEQCGNWNALCDIETTPVLDDEEAATALRKSAAN